MMKNRMFKGFFILAAVSIMLMTGLNFFAQGIASAEDKEAQARLLEEMNSSGRIEASSVVSETREESAGPQPEAAALYDSFDSYVAPAWPANGWDWAKISGTGTATTTWFQVRTPVNPSATPVSSPNVLLYNSFSISTGNVSRIFRTSGVDLSGLGGVNVDLKFAMYHDSAYSTSDDTLQACICTDGTGTTWTTIGPVYHRYLAGAGGWNYLTQSLNAYTGVGFTDVRIGFLCSSAYGNNILIDDVKIAYPGPTLAYTSSAITADTCTLGGPGQNNGIIDPGETVTLNVTLNNTQGDQPATGISATLSSTTPGITVGTPTQAYGDIAVGATGTNTTPFQFTVAQSMACGTTINLNLHVTATGGWAWDIPFTRQVGSTMTLYQENFDTGITPPAFPAGWLTQNIGGNGYWVTGTTYYCSSPNDLRYRWSTSGAADSWAFSPGISLASGTTYTVSFGERVYSVSFPEILSVYVGMSQANTSMTQEILAPTTYTNGTCQTLSFTFTVPVTGTYYLGFHSTSAVNMFYLLVDDIKVTYPACTPCPYCTIDSCAATVPATGWTNIPANMSATSSTSYCTDAATYDWTFGDSATGSGSSVSHAYTAAGNYTVNVTVDVEGEICTDNSSILIADCPAITVTNPAVTTGTVNSAFSQVFTQSGGAAPVTFSTLSALPAGITLATNGTLSGTPTASGTFPVVVNVTDVNGCIGTGATYSLVISCQAITVTNPAVTTGTVNSAFSEVFTQSGGVAPVTFTTASVLPTGISLAAGGTLSGTPTVKGTFPITVTATDTYGCTGTSAAYDLVISCQTITVTNPAVTTGTVNTAFSQTFTQVGGIGTFAPATPVIFATVSTLPAGLTLAAGGTLSGTPTVTGTFPIVVTATDANGCVGTGTTYNLVIGCQTIAVTNPAVTTGTAGATFNQTFTQSGGIAPVTFATASALPAGISLAASGTLSGTPTVTGNFPITVTATDNNGCTGTGATYTLVISCPTVSVTNPAVTTGTTGSAFSQTFTQSGGVAPITFSTASVLPAGLLFAANGTLSGTPTVTGNFPITVTATDTNGCTGTGATYTLVISCPTITVNNPAVTTGTAGSAFSQIFTQSGGIAPATFSTGSALPAGLSLAANGTLSGTPTATGTFPITVTATDAYGCTGTGAVYTLVISCAVITVTPVSLPGGTTGTAYSQTITASDGTAPYTYSVTSGALPAGLTLSAAGLLSGIPSASGTFPITVTATDAHSCSGSQAYSLVIVPETPSTPIITDMIDNDPCAQGSITIVFTAGAPATRHDLYRDGILAQSNVTSPLNYNPADVVSHSYVVRAINIDDAVFTDSAPSAFADQAGMPSQPSITSITDPSNLTLGLVITYTAGTPANRHDLYKDGVLVSANFPSGGTYVSTDTATHSFQIAAVNITCVNLSAPVSAADAGSRIQPKPKLPIEPLPFPHRT
jgi:hypothetical protein